mmetsp:Transcript_80599/g.111991  ORF Transcript_80599/g.111991 Transcript_80599/m.111991 type:complete len:202 (-) Transcript_80599:59-664(-)
MCCCRDMWLQVGKFLMPCRCWHRMYLDEGAGSCGHGGSFGAAPAALWGSSRTSPSDCTRRAMEMQRRVTLSSTSGLRSLRGSASLSPCRWVRPRWPSKLGTRRWPGLAWSSAGSSWPPSLRMRRHSLAVSFPFASSYFIGTRPRRLQVPSQNRATATAETCCKMQQISDYNESLMNRYQTHQVGQAPKKHRDVCQVIMNLG